MARHGLQTIQPPVILALELSGMCGSIALVSQGLTVCEHSLYTPKTHSQRLIDLIDRIICDSEISWDEISAIAVSLGPGSFTGLRIALSTAKGLAMAFGKQLIGIPTLDGLANQLHHFPTLVCPIIDARKKEVYTALYKCDASGVPNKKSDYMVLSPIDLISLIKEPTIFVGDGVTVYGDEIRENAGDLAIFSPIELNFTRASSIGMLATKKYLADDFLDPATASPLYVRASDAELNYKKKS